MTQQSAISGWRKDRALADPAPYAKRADGAVWCSINQNEGWYYQQPSGAVVPEGNPFFDVSKWLGGQQRSKIFNV
jgi:hypothetical protein